MTSGSAANDFQLVPGQAQLAADDGFVDATTCAQPSQSARDVAVVGQSAQQIMNAGERFLLSFDRAGVETDGGVADRAVDPVGGGDDPFERDPPQATGPACEIIGDIDGERRVIVSHGRQREVAVIAIAVVEGEAREPSREVALGQPAMHFVRGHDVDSARSDMGQDHAQKFRSHFQVMIGLEQAVSARPHMVQHEDRSDPCEDRPQQVMGAAEVQDIQSGPDDGVAELLHLM